MLRLSFLFTLTLLVALGLSACSGDSGPVSPSTSPMPTSPYTTESVLGKYPTTVPLLTASPLPVAVSPTVVPAPTVSSRTESVLAKYPTTVPITTATRAPLPVFKPAPTKQPLVLAITFQPPTPIPTVRIVAPIISAPVPLVLIQPTPKPLPQPRIVVNTPVPQVVPIVRPPDPERTPASLVMTDEEATRLGLGAIAAVAENLVSQPSLNFKIDITTDTGTERAHWSVSYTNMLQGEENRKASGVVTSSPSGARFIFDSLHGSTCWKLTEPEEGQWTYHEHERWSRMENPDMITPRYH